MKFFFITSGPDCIHRAPDKWNSEDNSKIIFLFSKGKPML